MSDVTLLVERSVLITYSKMQLNCRNYYRMVFKWLWGCVATPCNLYMYIACKRNSTQRTKYDQTPMGFGYFLTIHSTRLPDGLYVQPQETFSVSAALQRAAETKRQWKTRETSCLRVSALSGWNITAQWPFWTVLSHIYTGRQKMLAYKGRIVFYSSKPFATRIGLPVESGLKYGSPNAEID